MTTPAPSIEDLTTPLTTDQVKQSIYDVLAAVGVTTTNWKPGAVVRTMIAACAIVIAALSSLTAKLARAGWIELAEGSWLTLAARYVYNVERVQATFAAGSATIDNAGGGVYAYAVGDLILENNRTHKLYRNTAVVNIAALQTGVSVSLAALEAGSEATAFPGEITIFQAPQPGLTVTNVTAVIGLDAEDDPTLRQRCRDKLGALSPMGPADAYASAARNATRADGTPIGINRIRITKDGLGNVYVYVATASGAVTGDADDPNTDLGAIDVALHRNAAPLCDTVHTLSSVNVPFAFIYELWLYNDSGLTEAQIIAAVQAEVAAWIPTVPIGGDVIDINPGRLYRSAVEAVIGRTRVNGTSLRIAKVNILSPATDFTMTIDQVITIFSVSPFAIHQLPPAGSA